MAVIIDPESFVSRNDLRFDFGLTDFVIDEAIRSGQLSPIQGASRRFLGSQVVEFLTNVRAGNAAGPRSRGRSPTPVVQAQTTPSATSAAGTVERKKMMITEEEKGVVKLFNEEVAAIMANGCDRGRAVELVAKRKPTLHKMYLLATNSSPAARRNIMDAAPSA